MTQLTTPKSPAFRSTSATSPVDILILGAGWTYQFLLPLLESEGVTHAATTRDGHDHTIPFEYHHDPDQSTEPYKLLPPANTILITFPLKGSGQSKELTGLYSQAHDESDTPRWIQLGSTGIFTEKGWNDANSSYDNSNDRAIAEDELLSLHKGLACVLNLAGLYGGQRQPKNWITRVAKSKEDVKGKGALHLIHGNDVARAVVLAHQQWENVARKRWILTDLHSYDWWDLIMAWGKYARESAVKGEEKESRGQLHFERWVVELMQEEGVRALPRDKGGLGRLVDGRAFWEAVGSAPKEGRVS